MTNTEIANASKIMLGSTEAVAMYIGSTLIWQQSSSPLPYDCLIEYLESTGTLYINTNYEVWNHGLSGEIKMQRTGDSTGEKAYIGRTTSSGFDLYTKSDSGIGLWIDSGNGSIIDIISGSQYFDKNIHIVLFEMVLNGTSYISIDGDVYGNTYSLGTREKSPILLFSHRGYYNSEGRIYYCRIYDEGTLVLDLIPVRVGLIGYMYDKISGQLFGNDGTGNFILGRDKLPTGYTELKYISSSSGGNQYIDLGIKLYETLNTDYDIAMKFNIASGNANQAAIFACQDSDNDPWPGTFVRVNSSSGKAIGRYIGGTAKDNTIGNIGADIELPVQTSPNKNVTSLNNNNSTHQYGTSLFCAFVGGTNTPARYCNAKLYYFKLFVGGTLVRDLIPCKNSSNVVGMYDVVNNVFYTSPNGNAFVAGPAV